MVLFSIVIGQGKWAFVGLKHESTARSVKSAPQKDPKIVALTSIVLQPTNMV